MPNLHLVLVGGNFKSGTSLLCEHIESLGYRNPACLTGAAELGHGIGAGMYLTRECPAARRLNRALSSAHPKDAQRLENGMADYLETMVSALGPRLVIKDPYMKLFAEHWFRASKQIGVERRTLVLTRRPDSDIFTSWSNSKFLSRIHKKDPSVFRALSAPIAADQTRQLEEQGVQVRVVDFEQLPGLIQRGRRI